MILGRWQAQKTARLYLNESRAILAEMKLVPLEQRLAPFRTFFQNSDPADNLKHLSRCKATGRPDANKVWGDVERNALPLNQRRDEKNSWCPLGPGQGLGCGPPGQGGTIIRICPLPRVVDREGGR